MKNTHFEFQGVDQMEMMINMMTKQMIAQDKIFRDSGVENDEFEASLMHYCTHDKEVQARMQEYMMTMQGHQ